MLADHFGVVHFAHMSEVLGKAAHAAFGGMRVERISAGDVPDYLCAREVTEPLLAEAKADSRLSISIQLRSIAGGVSSLASGL